MAKSTLFTQLKTLDELTSEYRIAELRRIAKDKDTPAATLLLLSEHNDLVILDSVLGNTNTPNSVIQFYIDRLKKVPSSEKHVNNDRYALSWAARAHGNLSRSIQEYFMSEPELIGYLAENPKTDYDLLEKIADKEILKPGNVAYNLAKNKTVKSDIIAKLYNSGNFDIWAQIASNDKLSASMLDAMYQKTPRKQKHGVVYGIVRNKAASSALLERIYEEDSSQQAYIARNPSLSHEFLLDILKNDAKDIKNMAVLNRNVTVEDLLTLAATGKEEDLEIAVRSKKFPAQEVTRLLNLYFQDNSRQGRSYYDTVFYSEAFKVARKTPGFIVPAEVHPYSSTTEKARNAVVNRLLGLT